MPSLGQQLKQAREERGLTIKQIAEGTHIGTPFLQAIESDNYESLPGGIFNRAFVRKFASQVGFDQEQAVKLYDEQLVEMGGEPVKTSYLGLGDEMEAKSSSSGNGLLLALIAVIVLGAILYAAYLAFSPSRRLSDSNAAAQLPPQPATATPAPAETPNATASPEASVSPTVSPTPEATTSGLRIKVTADTSDCWMNLRPDSAKIEQITLKQGETCEFTVDEKLTFIRVGNLPALNIAINGKRAN